MLTRWRGGPATAIVIFVVVCLLVTSIPAYAVTDLAAGQSGYIGTDCGGGGGPYGPYIGTAAALTDTNDSSFVQYGNNAFPTATWAAVSVGTSQVAGSLRVLFREASGGDTSPNGNHYHVWGTNTSPSGCDGSGYPTTAYTDFGDYSYTGGSSNDTGVAAFTNSASFQYYGVTFGIHSSGARSQMASFEVYAGASIGDPLDYIYNLRAAHPSFARQYRWNWAQTFFGSYTFTDSSARVIASRSDTFVAGSEEPLPPQPPVTILCLPICGHDTYTITITDGSTTATYDIDSDADGTLIPDVVPPLLTGATFCYIHTTGQCSDLPGYVSGVAAVGQIWTYYNFTGAAGQSYNVELCERAQELLPPECWPYTTPTGGVSGTVTPGSHTSVFVHDTSHFESDQSEVHVYDNRGHHTYLISPLLDIGGGGSVSITQQQPITPESTIVCGQLDVLCGIRALFSLGPGAIEAGFGTLMTPLRAKQPFATIIGSAPTILAQLGRASDAVTSTDNCTGVDIQVPLGIAGLMTPPPVNGHAMPTPPVAPSSIPGAAGRTSGPFTARVLDCATFESIVGGWSWFPAFRAFQDVALYAVYGYSQLRRWQPKPQMTA